MAMKTVLGFMSGTSLDGIDAAIIKTDGQNRIENIARYAIDYSKLEKDLLTRVTVAALNGEREGALIAMATEALHEAHMRIFRKILRRAKLEVSDIDLIGMHGQTIYHRPASIFDMMNAKQRDKEKLDAPCTIQLGDAERLSIFTDTDVVSDFRHQDVAAGGEGAPLAPIYHMALVTEARKNFPEYAAKDICVLNIGGVANVTYIPSDSDDVLAFDTGPGNGLIDQWVAANTDQAFDKGGKLAKAGKVDNELLMRMIGHDYFNKPAPKSLDRYDFEYTMVQDLSVEDGAATLTAFTAAAVAAADAQLPMREKLWVVCGGGRRNASIMRELKKRLGHEVIKAEKLGWRGDDIEAECFAYLAMRRTLDLPISFPNTTKAPKPMTGGTICRCEDVRYARGPIA